MSETSRRVNVTLTFATDDDMHGLLADVMVAAGEKGHHAVTATVHEFILGDDMPESSAHLVIRDGALYSVHVDDPEGAEGRAFEVQGVVVELPVVADYRAEETR